MHTAKYQLQTKKRYCWTHGVQVSSHHNSINCRDPGAGRKSEATRDNKMGGKDAWQGGQIEHSKVKVNVENNLICYKTSVAHNKTAILDSGFSSHYLKRGAYCTNMRKAHIPIYVKLPDWKRLASSATSDLNINALNPRAPLGTAHNSLLVSGQMCDAGYRVLFDEGKAKIIDGDVMVNGTVVMEGKLDRTTWLWTALLDNKIQQCGNEYERRRDEIANNVYKIRKVYDTTQ
jgi:hypothetical protein